MTCTTKYVVTPVHEHDWETCEAARAEWIEQIMGDMPATFDLIHVDRGDRLTDEQARYYVTGDWECLWDSLSDWEGDARWHGIRYWVGEAEREHGDDAPTCPDCGEALCDWEDIRDDLEEYIGERDSGDWLDDLVSGVPDVWMQYRPKTDGYPLDSLQFVGYDPEGVWEVLRDCVERLGVTPSDDMIDGIADWTCEGDYVTSSIVFKCDLSNAAADSPTVTIREGMIYVGNPFSGNGALVDWQGELTVPRDCVELDGDTGYGVQEIFGL